MDIFDRLGNLIRTILDDDSPEQTGGIGSRSSFSADPDMRTAWEELESYMNEEDPTGKSTSSGPSGTRSGTPESLRKDFRNLEVPFGAPIADVRRSYKRLLAAFHPDRHSADPERFKTATEVTKKLNQSFDRIESHYESAG